MTPAQGHETAKALVPRLRDIVGRRQVITGRIGKAPFCRGFRAGSGDALAIVRPGTLLELWRVLEGCVEAGTAIIMQAANTGLTGGSTPLPAYDRPAVVINTLRIKGIRPILDNRQVVCLAGSTLQGIETVLKPLGRQPHSVLGSSCIGASVVGGICNNSGGALVERGPAYSEFSLYARVTHAGRLELVNSLGIRLGETPEEILTRLDAGRFGGADIVEDQRPASATDYKTRVRDIDSPLPARYNADPSHLHEASGCAGKLAVFAVRLDTFERYETEQTFFVSTSDPDRFARLRRRVLQELPTLPVYAEYIHRDTMDLALRYGNDTVWLIDKLGTQRIPALFRARSRVEALASLLPGMPENFTDRLLQIVCRRLPSRIPGNVQQALERHEHHLILKTHDGGSADGGRLLAELSTEPGLDYLACSCREAELVALYRFAAAGAAVRYEACHRAEVSGVVSLDIALPRNTRAWFESLPASLEARLRRKLYYGHFLCHVLHQDYVVNAGEDCAEVKDELLALLRERGAKYPAEHNHGHLYEAPPDVQAFYRDADPSNSLNPGVGRMSTNRFYA